MVNYPAGIPELSLREQLNIYECSTDSSQRRAVRHLNWFRETALGRFQDVQEPCGRNPKNRQVQLGL